MSPKQIIPQFEAGPPGAKLLTNTNLSTSSRDRPTGRSTIRFHLDEVEEISEVDP